MTEIVQIGITKEELISLLDESLAKLYAMKPQTNEDPDEQLLKIDDVCRLLKISRVTVHHWKKVGRLPYLKLGHRIYFLKSKIMEVLQKKNGGSDEC